MSFSFFIFFIQLKNSSGVEHEEIKKIVSSGKVGMSACVATAWTTLVIGYASFYNSYLMHQESTVPVVPLTSHGLYFVIS